MDGTFPVSWGLLRYFGLPDGRGLQCWKVLRAVSVVTGQARTRQQVPCLAPSSRRAVTPHGVLSRPYLGFFWLQVQVPLPRFACSNILDRTQGSGHRDSFDQCSYCPRIAPRPPVSCLQPRLWYGIQELAVPGLEAQSHFSVAGTLRPSPESASHRDHPGSIGSGGAAQGRRDQQGVKTVQTNGNRAGLPGPCRTRLSGDPG